MSKVNRVRLALVALILLMSTASTLFAIDYDGLEQDALQGLSARGQTLAVDGFDPVEDVPAMVNWKGDMNVKGAGCCYAASLLTYHFFHKVEFTGQAGVSAEEWRRASDDAKPVLALEDDAALDVLGEWIARKDPARIKVGPATSLHDFTRAGTPGETMFKNWAEAIQYHLQVKNDGLRYVGSIARSRLGFLPGCGRDDVNKNGLGIIRDRLRDGKLVPTVFHPDGLQFSGHVMLVYAMEETDDEAVLTMYDVNHPPVDGESRPTVCIMNKKNGSYTCRRFDGADCYDYPIISVLKPEGFLGRRNMRKIVTNYEETLERNAHLGRVASDGNSVLERIGGAAGFVLEHINPF